MRKIVAAIAVLVVVIGGVIAWLVANGGHGAAAKSATAVVTRGDISVTASASGNVVALDQRALNFGTSGTVATLKVKTGDHVSTGEVLATLDASNAQNAVTAAQSALDAAQQNLTLATQQAAAATAIPSPTTTGPARATGGGGGTTGGVGATGGSGAQGTGGTGSRTSSSGDSVLHAQQAVNNDELALEQAQAQLSGTSIVAPSAGRVLSVAGAVGDNVNAGGSGFIVISGINAFAIDAQFSEADVAAIKVGQNATVTLANHPGTKYDATVVQIDPAGTTSGSLVQYGVELTFAAVPANLLLGQSADVAVTTASANNVLYVPAAAVTKDATGRSVVVVQAATGEQTYEVTTGLEADQGVEITSGLAAGETVVIR
jgi:multidrug efflux pump subunit AcrA (membrane-fusion protein)